jgi:glycosyltransferase involved in cell wall biosynthesis
MNSPLVSVIMPVYNASKYVEEAVASVLNQTYQNFEIIVVDDGSTDNTKFEVKKIRDQRVRYIKLQKNKGGSNARNIGIKRAKGEYISFLDSDDILYPDKLEIQMKNIINKTSNLDFCKINVIHNSSYSYFIPNKLQEKSIFEGNVFDELINKRNFISTQAILVKKNFITKYLFDPKMPRLQDYDLILRMIPEVNISYSNKVLVNLYLQKDSLTSSRIKLKQAINLLLSVKDYIYIYYKRKIINKKI